MKKFLIISLVLIAVIFAAFYSVRNYFLPKVIAQSVQSEKPVPAFLPKKIEKTVEAVKENVDKNMEDLPELMNQLHLTFDDLLIMIDQVNANEVMSAQSELFNTNLRSTDHAFDIIAKHVHLEGYDLEIFRPIFNEKMTVKKINRIMKVAEDNQLQTSMSIPTARNTAKQILLNNREKIETELEQIKG